MKRLLFVLSMLYAAGCSAVAPVGDSDPRRSASADSVAQNDCSMSFRDLFVLAKGREWSEDEVQAFQALDQEGKNRAVKQLAAEAGCIRTEDQVGTDGVVYTAFWKE